MATKLKEIEKAQSNNTKDYIFKNNWYEELKNKEIEILSTTPRKSKINLYSDDKGGYILNIAIPYSNVSSLDRKGRDNILPNWFKDVSYHLNSNYKEITPPEISYRSTSIDPFDIKDLKERHKTGVTIAKNEFSRYVTDNILNRINNTPEGKLVETADLFKVNFFNMGLVSNVAHETKHVSSTYKIYQQLAKEPFYLTDANQQEIKAALQKKNVTINSKALVQKIDTSNIILMNFGCNMVRGFDQNGLQNKINKDACQKITVQLFEIAKSDPKIAAILKQLSKQPTVAKWQANRKQYLTALQELEQSATTDKTKQENYKKLHAYVGFMDLCLDKQPINLLRHNEDEQKNSYLRQVTAVHMAELLGMTCRTNCKSGKDRTGAFYAAKQAAQITNHYQLNTQGLLPVSVYETNKTGFTDAYRTDFWNNFVTCVKHTTGRSITSDNCWGANGLQSQNQKHIYPEKELAIAKLIDAKKQDAYAKIHKLPYEKRKPITNHLKQSNTNTFFATLKNGDDSMVTKNTIRQIIKNIIDKNNKVLVKSTIQHISKSTAMNSDIRTGIAKIMNRRKQEDPKNSRHLQPTKIALGAAQVGFGVARKTNLGLQLAKRIQPAGTPSSKHLTSTNPLHMLHSQKTSKISSKTDSTNQPHNKKASKKAGTETQKKTKHK